MAKTTNYQWDLPSPTGIQITEISRIATTFSAIDIKVKSFETALSAHKHAFSDLTDRPTTLGGYGITDGMTAQEVADAIKTAVDELIGGSSTALDTLKELADALGNDPDFATSVGEALGVRVRVDAAQSFSAAQKSRGRSNIDAVGTGDVGISVAPLGSDGKVPSGYLPALTTTATVGAAAAGANSKQTPADGDFFAGVEAGGSTMFKTTWGNIKAAFTAIVNSIVSGNMSGRAYPRTAAGAALDVNWGQVQAQPRHILGAATDSPDVRPYAPNSITVGAANWANGANYADRLGPGGWTLGDVQYNINTRIIRDWASHVGFIANNPASPYIRHGEGSGEIVRLARHDQVMPLIAAQGPTGIGTYAFLYWMGAPTRGPGDTEAGSNLRWSSAWGNDGTSAPGGSWRCFGWCDTNTRAARTTLWMRYA